MIHSDTYSSKLFSLANRWMKRLAEESSERLVTSFLQWRATHKCRLLLQSLKLRTRVWLRCVDLATCHHNRRLLRHFLAGLSSNMERLSIERRARLYGEFFYSIRRLKWGVQRLKMTVSLLRGKMISCARGMLYWKFRRLFHGFRNFGRYNGLCKERRRLLYEAKANYSAQLKRTVGKIIFFKAGVEASRRIDSHRSFPLLRYCFDCWTRVSKCNHRAIRKSSHNRIGEATLIAYTPPTRTTVTTKKSSISKGIDPRSNPRHRLEVSPLNEVIDHSTLSIPEKKKILASGILALVSQLKKIRDENATHDSLI